MISVVAPVYNGDKRLRRLLDSIVSQTFTDFRVLIIDNGSTDNSPRIAREFAERDPRFVYCPNPRNMGFAFSYQRGYFASLDCEFMTYLSSSDYIAPTYFAQCVEALKANPKATLAYSYCKLTDANGGGISLSKDDFNLAAQGPGERYATVLGRLKLCTAFYGVIRMSFYSQMQALLSVPSAAMDNLMLAALALVGPFIEVPEPLLIREWTASNQDASYLDRQNRLTTMSFTKSRYAYHYMIFYKHVLAHFQALGLGLELVNPGRVQNQRVDLELHAYLIQSTLGILFQRYKEFMDADLEYFVNTVVAGKILASPDPEAISMQWGDLPINEQRFISFLLSKIEEIYWLVKEPPANFHLSRAMLYLWQGRRAEGLLAVERELELYPTSRLALECRLKLKNALGNK